jgi:hypothetical protein
VIVLPCIGVSEDHSARESAVELILRAGTRVEEPACVVLGARAISGEVPRETVAPFDADYTAFENATFVGQ